MFGIDEVIKAISKNHPVIGACLLVGIVVGVIILSFCVYSFKKYFHWTGRIKKSEEDCGKIDTQIIPKLNNMNDSVMSLTGSVKALTLYLHTKDKTLNTNLIVANSPLKLTSLGSEILTEIAGDSFIDEHLPVLVKKMDEYGVTTALDSQNIAPLVITDVSTEASFNKIKDYMYNTPFYKKEINGETISVALDINTVSTIMGIYLRDKYLELHPELNPDDIPTLVK